MNRATRALVVAAAVVGVGLGGYGIASAATGSDPGAPAPSQEEDEDGPNESKDSDAPLTGSDLDRAVAVALEHTGGGEVTETEIGDDGAAYGVEIRKPDGTQVEVNLDADFKVIGSVNDDD